MFYKTFQNLKKFCQNVLERKEKTMDNKDNTRLMWFGWQGVKFFSWFMLGVSIFLSYYGFTHASPNIPWWIKLIAFGFSIGIIFVEFMLNKMSMEELMNIDSFGDVVLRVFGFSCYAYDILTNIFGFILIMFLTTESPMEAWKISPVMTTFCVLFGVGFAIGPEPLYVIYLKNKTPFAYKPKPVQQQNQPKKPIPFNQSQKSQYKPKYKPQLGGVVPVMESNFQSFEHRKPWHPQSSYLQSAQDGEE